MGIRKRISGVFGFPTDTLTITIHLDKDGRSTSAALVRLRLETHVSLPQQVDEQLLVFPTQALLDDVYFKGAHRVIAEHAQQLYPTVAAEVVNVGVM